MKAIAIQIPNFFPVKTAQELTSEEVREHFPAVVEKDQEIKNLLKQVYDETNGNIPNSLRILAERIHDPVMLAVVIYNISQTVTREIYDQKLSEDLPELLKEAMTTGSKIGADMAMQHMNADPESDQNPGQNPAIPAPDDPVYYG